MLIDISGNSFSSLGNPQDIDAQRFISAATITSSTQIQAIDTLVFNLKKNNLWDKMQAIYPVVGGNATSHSYNLKDPRNLDAAFRLNFVNGWTHNSSGMTPNGVNAYANTFLNASSFTTSNHLAFYSRTQSTGATSQVEMGAFNNTNNWLLLFVANTYSAGNPGTFDSYAQYTTKTDARGFWVGTKIADNNRSAYLNGRREANNTATHTTAHPNFNIWIGARNNSNSPALPSNKECAFASIGLGLTDSEAAIYSTIVEAYQTTLGRQVVQATTLDRPPQTTLPTVTYNPKQIYGNDLYVWVDMTDWRNMYNTVTGDTNIASTGCVALTGVSDTNPNHTNVRRLEDLAGNFTGSNRSRKFYTWIRATTPAQDVTANSPLPPNSGVTGTTNLFINNVLDTNKGFFSGNSYFQHPLALNNPINFLAPNSAVTICSYMPQNVGAPGSMNYNAIGLGLYYYLGATWFGFANDANSHFTNFQIPTGNTQGFTKIRLTSAITSSNFFGSTIMITGVICGRTWDFYVNNSLITSGTLPSQVTYPFSTSTVSNVNILMSTGLDLFGYGIKNSTPRSIWEGFIANSYTSPQQINLLYDYFRVKFKDRTYDLF